MFVIICLFKVSKTLPTEKTTIHISQIIKFITQVKGASALKYGWKSNEYNNDNN